MPPSATGFGPLPPYRRIAERFRRAILRGDYAAGDRLPSVRELAVSEGINPNTAQSVYDLLEQDGWVERRQGSGTFVRGSQPVKRAARRSRLEDLLTDARREAKRLGASEADWWTAIEKAGRHFDLPEEDL